MYINENVKTNYMKDAWKTYHNGTKLSMVLADKTTYTN